MDEPVIASSGNIFADLGFPPDEAMLLSMRADLMADLRLVITQKGWTRTEAAKVLRITQSRVSDLVCGKWAKFSLDMLVMLAIRAGIRVEVRHAA
ncbi:MAG: XRE family transcriptional regulator [Magnetococcales bacterium]|nr:XRE family transcriptional regulator [Magnetococcales bacterium]